MQAKLASLQIGRIHMEMTVSEVQAFGRYVYQIA